MIDKIYRCEICGEESQNPIRWIAIHCSNEQLTVFVDTDGGGRQYLAETIWNESRPPIVPKGNGGISRTKVDADHPISLR